MSILWVLLYLLFWWVKSDEVALTCGIVVVFYGDLDLLKKKKKPTCVRDNLIFIFKDNLFNHTSKALVLTSDNLANLSKISWYEFYIWV
jgi:hypothetical protein